MREVDDSSGAADMLEASCHVMLLREQAFRRKDSVGRGLGLLVHGVQEFRNLGVARPAGRAVGEMFGRRRIHGNPAPIGKIGLEQAIVPQVAWA
jgi:hypothetical protein